MKLTPDLKLSLSCGDEGGSGSRSSATPTKPEPKPPAATETVAPSYAGRSTDMGSIEGFEYSILNDPAGGGARRLVAEIIDRNPKFSSDDFHYPAEYVTVNYTNDDGFKGVYTYEGNAGKFTVDVEIEARFSTYRKPTVTGSIGKGKPIVLEGDHLGAIELDYSVDVTETGRFTDPDVDLSHNENSYYTTGTVRGQFSNDGTLDKHPDYVAGEVTLRGFSKTWGDDDGHRNSIVGVFVGEREQ